MTTKKQLSNKWLKASVLGCLWASSEIVLGSFLHNLRIPFAGNILTAIGIILLISVAYIWKEKGLFWRSGLVCAVMKSISPSAIIFGPMIAIFCEALLMEFSVRIFRRNIFSFLLAGMLAMSWNLFQVLVNFIIKYGINIIDLYVNLTKFAQKQLNIVNDNYWLPVMILLCLYLVFGLIAAIFGIYIGRKASKQPLEIDSLTTAQVLEIKSKKDNLLFHFSYIWLLCNVLFLVAELALMSYLRWEYWTIFGLSILIIWSIRYKRSLKPLAKPKFWLFFVLLTMISGFVLFKINNSDSGFFKGLLIGLEMNFRAVITIVGFASIGTELRNPKFRNILANSHIRQLPIALEVAFDTLPLVISNLPKLQDVFKRPVKTFHELVSQADFWLEKFEFKIIKKENVVILRGIEKTGKSTCLKNLVENLKRKNIKAGGFISPSVFENNILIGYDLVDVLSNKRVVLSRTYGNEEMPKVGSYYFNKYCIDFGKQLFDINNLTDIEIVVIDEVGPWEIKNQGWAKSLNQLIRSFEKPMIWVVRESIVDKVVENWSLKNPMIIDIKENNIDMICDKIFSLLKKQYN
jgi:nucleoside-triphosphatase THEP1